MQRDIKADWNELISPEDIFKGKNYAQATVSVSLGPLSYWTVGKL